MEASAEARLADGYASDDEQKPRPSPRGYGALRGDLPQVGRPEPLRRPKLSEAERREYEIRQASSGPSNSKVRYLDAVLANGHYGQDPAQFKRQRLSWSQTHVPSAAFERHCKLMSWLPGSNPPAPAKSDLQLLREAHRFLREEEDEDGSWESRLAQKYYQRLFKEYVICDLAGYKKGNVGFRWRTEAEVVQGRGQFQCAHKRCNSKRGLQSFEVDFKYSEAGASKRALVKVRLCMDCAYKLHYRRLKKESRRRRKRKHERSLDQEHKADAVPVDSDSAAEGISDDEKAGAPAKAEETPTEADRRQIEALAWKGPDPEARTREDDFDDFFNDLFC